MRHPFAGIEKPETKSAEPREVRSRRSFFAIAAGTIAAGVTGLIGLSSSADAQSSSRRPRPPGNPTTLMIGEEAGRPPRRGWKK